MLNRGIVQRSLCFLAYRDLNHQTENCVTVCRGNCCLSYTFKPEPKFTQVLFIEEQGEESKNSGFSCQILEIMQENNADVNPCNLDVKQNHSRTVNCPQTSSMFSHLKTAAAAAHIKSTVASFYKSKRKQVTHSASQKKKKKRYKHPREPTKHS